MKISKIVLRWICGLMGLGTLFLYCVYLTDNVELRHMRENAQGIHRELPSSTLDLINSLGHCLILTSIVCFVGFSLLAMELTRKENNKLRITKC